MPASNFELPVDAADMMPRELAARVQTDNTPDHQEAMAWGERAYARALEPAVRQEDPTLSGEVARNMALRGELGGTAVEDVTTWLRRSFNDLRRGTESKSTDREIAASHFMRGRIMHHQLQSGRGLNATATRGSFRQAERILRSQHTFGDHWDRYGTMSARHWATFDGDETIRNTRPALATVLAVRGMWRAVRAEHEDQPRAAHRAFVKKQLGANALAGLVAASQPVAAMPGIRTARRRARHKLKLG